MPSNTQILAQLDDGISELQPQSGLNHVQCTLYSVYNCTVYITAHCTGLHSVYICTMYILHACLVYSGHSCTAAHLHEISTILYF